LSLFVAFVAMALLVPAGAAVARSLSLTESEYQIQWIDNAGRLEFRSNFGLPPVTCRFTMAGRYIARTLSKVAGAVIGRVESASVETSGASSGRCRNGEATILSATLPWDITYKSFFGTLPRIRDVVVHIPSFSVRVSWEGNLICLYRSEASEPFIGFIAVDPTLGWAGPYDPEGEIASGDPICSALGTRLNIGGPGGYESRHAVVVTVSLI